MDGNSVKALAENSEVISSLINIIPALIYAVATCFAAVVGIWGVRSWRREFRGKRQIELAENVLALFYQAKDAINAIRNIFGYMGEGSTRQPEENETKEQKEARDKAYVADERFKKHQEVFNKLSTMRYRFMAEIGKKQAEPFDEIRKIINEILIAARMLAELWAPRSRRHYDEEKQAQTKKYEAIFWWQGSKDDISKRVDEVVADMDKTCKKIIMQK